MYKLTPSHDLIDQIDRQIKGFYSTIPKTNSAFKRQFLLILSTKSWSQTLLGCKNESRRGRNQEIQVLRCLNSSIAWNIQDYISCQRERIYNVLKLGVTIESSHWWDQQSRWNPKRGIVMVNSQSYDLHLSVKITPCNLVKTKPCEISYLRSWIDVSDSQIVL